MRKINQAGMNLNKSFESFKELAYDDARPWYRLRPGDKIEGTLTIGYGHTRNVKIGDRCTKEEAEAWLLQDLSEALNILDENITPAALEALTDNRYAALASLVFNIGPGRKGVRGGFVVKKNGSPSSLLNALNSLRFDAVPKLIQQWNKFQGKTSDGLTRRRAAETALWASKDRMTAEAFVPSALPEVSAAAPAGKVPDAPPSSRQPAAAAGTAASLVSSTLAETTEKLQPFAEFSSVIKWVLVGLALIAAGFTFWQIYKQWKQDRS